MVIWCGCRWVCRWTMAVLLHMCSGFPAKMVEQTFVTSLNDVMRTSHALEGENYKKGSATRLEEFGCCYYCHLGVSAQVLGSLLSHRPSTSLSQCPSSRMHILEVQCCLFLPIACILTYLEDFELLWLYLSGGDQCGPLPSPLEPGIEWSKDHNPTVANCTGRINC